MTAPQGARCALHPDAAASDTCARCGVFVCWTCAQLHEGKPYCPGCAKRVIQPLVRGSNQAYAAMALAVLPLVYPCVLPLGVVGLVLGLSEQGRIDRGEAPEAGRGLVKAAKICGGICTGLTLVAVVVGVAMFALR